MQTMSKEQLLTHCVGISELLQKLLNVEQRLDKIEADNAVINYTD